MQDTQHLKIIRNIFTKYDIQIGDDVASWKHKAEFCFNKRQNAANKNSSKAH